jgi:ribose transport system ATP-binding protein
MADGINLICADRVGESVVPNLSIRENLFLNPHSGFGALWRLIAPSRETREASMLGYKLGLRPNDPHLPIELLSGGNQQKVVVGRWLNRGGKVYVFEDPTAGVDVGAKAEIYDIIRGLADTGTSVAVFSSELEEVLGICDRIFLLFAGALVATVRNGPGIDASWIMDVVTGGEAGVTVS